MRLGGTWLADLAQVVALAASRHPCCDGVIRWEGAVAERGPADDLMGDAVLVSDLGRGAAAASLLDPRLHTLAVVLVGHGGSAELVAGARERPVRLGGGEDGARAHPGTPRDQRGRLARVSSGEPVQGMVLSRHNPNLPTPPGRSPGAGAGVNAPPEVMGGMTDSLTTLSATVPRSVAVRSRRTYGDRPLHGCCESEPAGKVVLVRRGGLFSLC